MKTYTHHTIEALESRIAPAAIGFSALAQDLNGKLASLQGYVDGAFAVGSLLPVVGAKIASAGQVFDSFALALELKIDQLASITAGKSSADVDTLVQQTLFGLLKPFGNSFAQLSLLADNDGNGLVTPADVIISHPTGDGSILIDLNLHAMAAISTDLDFNFGLASLPFQVSSTGGVTVAATLDFEHFSFGINSAGKFLFPASTPSQPHKFHVGLEASLTALELNATFGFVNGTIKDGVNGDTTGQFKTRLHAGIDVDLRAAAPSIKPSASADIYLQFEANVGSNFPGIGADFHLHYGGINASDRAPTVGFSNVHINLGSTLSNLIKPIYKVIQPILSPIKPLLDFVTTPIPVLSDVANAVGLNDLTLLSIAEPGGIVSTSPFNGLINLADKVSDVLEFVEKFKANPNTGKITLNVGDFAVMGSGGIDLRLEANALDLKTADVNANLSKLGAQALSSFDLEGKLTSALNGIDPALAAKAKEVFADLTGTGSAAGGIAYSFPFLKDPSGTVFGMLLGKDSDLFTLDASFHADASFEVNYPLFFAVEVGFAGAASIDLELHLGYDTLGVRTFALDALKGQTKFDDFADGLYITPATRAHLDANIGATGGFDLVLASLKLEGGVSVAVHLDPSAPVKDVDMNPDKIHIKPELGDCLFDLNGGASAYLDVAFRVGVGALSHTERFDIAKVSLLQFSNVCIPNPFVVPPTIHLATVDPSDSHVLRLNVGSFASVRGTPNDPNDPNNSFVNEDYQIYAGSKMGEVVIFAYGYTQTYSGITKIIGDAGTGNDTIIFSSLKGGKQVSPSVFLHGGSGNDQITYNGIGDATIFGDDGNDVIKGSAGTNFLNGGNGDDNITGGTGPNHLGSYADSANFYDEPGNDTLIGGKGLNLIIGGGGDDALFAGMSDGDVLAGEGGNDQLVAGGGRSSFYGGRGDDTILWKVSDGIPLILDGGNEFTEFSEHNTLHITGSDFADTLTLSKNPRNTLLSVGVTTAMRPGFNFSAHAIQNLTIEGGAGADRLTVNSLTGTAIENVGLNLGDVLKNTFHVNDGAIDVITVYGTGAADNVQIEAEQAEIAFDGIHKPLLGGIMKVSGLADYTVRLANVADDFTCNVLAGDDFTTILSNTGPTRLLGGTGNDSFTLIANHLGDTVNPLNPFNPKDYLGPVAVDAGAGTNKILFDQQTSVFADQVMLGQSQFSSKLLPAASFIATGGTFKGGVTLRTGTMADTIFIPSVLPGLVTTVSAGAGDDVITVGGSGNGTSGNLDAILGVLGIEAGMGANTLRLVDFSDANGNSQASITSTQVLNLAGPADNVPVVYQATGGQIALTIDGSNTSADCFTVDSLSGPLRINGSGGNDVVKAMALEGIFEFFGGDGDDKLTIGAGSHKLAGFFATAIYHGESGNDSLTLDDSANASPSMFTVNEASISFGTLLIGGHVTADTTLEKACVLGGSAANLFRVTSSSVLIGTVNLDGGLGADTLQGPDADSIWNINATDAGILNGNVTFKSMPNLAGGQNSDQFVLADGKGVTGTILGDYGVEADAASDTLDYSAYKRSVEVNLLSAFATGVAKGVHGINNVTGSTRSDLLVGDSAANVLAGNAGRDVIIGGNGADKILGGTDDDLLVGGSTEFDLQQVSLQRIIKEWRSTDDYLTRIAHLTTGGGLNGGNLLTPGIVHNDLITDVILGGEDSNDFFFGYLTSNLLLPGVDMTDFSVGTERNYSL